MSKTHRLGYLRTQRRSWGLTQKELAELIGCRCGTHISRIERDKRFPAIQCVLACEILFDIRAATMFPRLYGMVEDKVMRRVYALHQKLKDDDSLCAGRKRQFLEGVLNRAVNRHKS